MTGRYSSERNNYNSKRKEDTSHNFKIKVNTASCKKNFKSLSVKKVITTKRSKSDRGILRCFFLCQSFMEFCNTIHALVAEMFLAAIKEEKTSSRLKNS